MAETARRDRVALVLRAEAAGVRARLIDKDNQPAWRFDSVETLPAAYVAEHFEAPWPRNPLHDLEATS